MRKAEINRKTAETDIALSLELDGMGKGEIFEEVVLLLLEMVLPFIAL